MIKKITLITLMALGLGACDNTESFTIVNPSAKTSPATVFAKAVQKFGNSFDFYQAANCEDAVSKYRNTKNSIFIYNSSIEFAARNKKLNCLFEDEKDKTIIFVGSTPMHICRLPGSKKDFGSLPVTLGMASMYATKKHESLFKKSGANVKIIPFSGSKSVLAALYAKDIDLGWMGSGLAIKQKDKLDCIYSTDENAKNYLGKKWNNGVPNFTITYVIYTNAKGSALKTVQNLRNSGMFSNFLRRSNTSGTFNIEGHEIDIISYADKLQFNWAEK